MRYMGSAALLLILTQSLAGCATGSTAVTQAIPWDTGGNAGTSPPTDFLGTTDSEELVFKTGSVEAMRILPSNNSLPGLVGIGTTSPEHQLQVKGSISIYGVDGDTSLFFGQESPTTTTTAGEWGIQYWPAALGGGGLNFWKPFGSSVAGFGNNYLFLSDNGNIGTGTSTPNEQLEITKNFRLPASTASVGVIKSGPNRYIHNHGTNNFFAGVNAGNLNATLTGNLNTGVGADALRSLTTGAGNTAVGGHALIGNMAGSNNTAVGYAALTTAFVGNNNVAVGTRALNGNSAGANNTAVGVDALGGLQSGAGNTVLGFNTGNYNNSSLTNNIFLGANAGSSTYAGSNNINIGNNGGYIESGTIRIGTSGTHGKTFIAGINGVGLGPASHVCVNATHQLGNLCTSRSNAVENAS